MISFCRRYKSIRVSEFISENEGGFVWRGFCSGGLFMRVLFRGVVPRGVWAAGGFVEEVLSRGVLFWGGFA